METGKIVKRETGNRKPEIEKRIAETGKIVRLESGKRLRRPERLSRALAYSSNAPCDRKSLRVAFARFDDSIMSAGSPWRTTEQKNTTQ